MDSIESVRAEHKEYAKNLLKEIISTESVNPPGNELKICEIFKRELEGLNIVVEVQKNGARGNIIATLEGIDKTRSVVLNGHLDTVPFSDLSLWKHHPLSGEVINGKMYGRGTSDMKSGLVSQFIAFKKLAEEGFKPGVNIKFIGTYDEESSGEGASLINETGQLDDAIAIVIAEPTDSKISISSKGTLWLEVEVHGKTSHAAYPKEGINAVDIALEIYSLLKESIKGVEDEILGESTVAMTMVNAGIKTNMIPDKCNAAFDLRSVPGVSHDEILTNLNKLISGVESTKPGAKITYSIMNNREPLSVGKDNKTVLTLMKALKNMMKVDTQAQTFSAMDQYS